MKRFTPLLCLFVALAVTLAACSKEKLNELVDSTKEKISATASTVTDSAKETLNLAGNVKLTLDAPLAADACYASFLKIGEGRPTVLQLRTYRDPAQESFPSMLLRAPVQAGGVSELVGQVVTAQIFAQSSQDSPVWYSAPGSHVELKIVASDDKTLTAEVVSGNLRNTATGNDQAVTGTLTAVW